MARVTRKITLALVKEIAGTDAVVCDTEITGFSARAGKNGVSFYILKKHNKRKYEKTLGHFPEMTVEEARSEALKFVASLANFEIPEAVTASLKPTVGEAAEWYAGTIKSQYDARQKLAYWKPYWNKRIVELTRADVMAMRDSLKKTPVMSNEVIRYLGTAISAFSRYLDIELPNPAKGMPKFHTEPRRRFLSDDEAPRLLKELEVMRTEWRYRVQSEALLMMIYTGARKSNVLQMNLAEISRGIWTVPYNKSKSSRSIVIPLNKFALEILERRTPLAVNGYLFTRAGIPLLDVKRTMATACKRAGVEDCHVHDLRRTLGSWMLMNGTPIEVVSRTLGHSSIRVTETVYAHLLPHKISDATNAAVEAMLRGKV